MNSVADYAQNISNATHNPRLVALHSVHAGEWDDKT
jgi:hypothetical protein